MAVCVDRDPLGMATALRTSPAKSPTHLQPLSVLTLVPVSPQQTEEEPTRCSVYSVTTSGGSKLPENSEVVESGLAPKYRWAETGVDNPVFAGDLDAASWNPTVKESIVNGTQVGTRTLG